MKNETTFWTPSQESTLLTAEAFQASADRIRGTIKVAPSNKSKTNTPTVIKIAIGAVALVFVGACATTVHLVNEGKKVEKANLEALHEKSEAQRIELLDVEYKRMQEQEKVNAKEAAKLAAASVVQCEVLPGQVVEKQSQEACDKDKEFMGNLPGTLENLKSLQDDQLRN
jgi:hypothetical protein